MDLAIQVKIKDLWKKISVWLEFVLLIQSKYAMYVTDSMQMGRTTSVPKSALHYELDKARYLGLETTPVLFSQN